MSYSVKANKVVTLEFDIQELRTILSDKAQEILGKPEQSFERRIEMDPLFVVQHGEATLSGIRMTVKDSFDDHR